MAWKNASDGKETGMDLRPNAYSRRPGRVKRDLATAGPESLGSGLERQGCFGELGRGVRESEEARGLAQHRGVDEEAQCPQPGTTTTRPPPRHGPPVRPKAGGGGGMKGSAAAEMA